MANYSLIFQAWTGIASNQLFHVHFPPNAGFQLSFPEVKHEHKHPMTCLYLLEKQNLLWV